MFPKAVIMKYQKLRGLKQQKCVSSGGQQSETKVLASHTVFEYARDRSGPVPALPLMAQVFLGLWASAPGTQWPPPPRAFTYSSLYAICFPVQIFLFKDTSYRIRANLHYLILTWLPP